jgi:membrane-associated PAP2 superfamily phosphatase
MAQFKEFLNFRAATLPGDYSSAATSTMNLFIEFCLIRTEPHYQNLLIISFFVPIAFFVWQALQGIHFLSVCKDLLPNLNKRTGRHSKVLLNIMLNKKKSN